MRRVKTTEKYIQQAISKHKGRYSYDQLVYVDYNTKVLIGCDVHGYFEQRPTDHLQGNGCPMCAVADRTRTKDFFIKSAIAMHGNTYDYSKVIYKSNKNKVEIVCKKHGSFWQRPDNHLFNSSGCVACAGSCPIVAKRDFVKKASKIHPDYDFSKFVYVNSATKGIYICPVHNNQSSTPRDLLSGYGCSCCAGNNPDMVKRNFYTKVSKIHPTYNFNDFIYKGRHKKGNYGCPIHGKKSATAGSLLSGQGCPECNKPGLTEKAIRYKLTKYLKNIEIYANIYPTILRGLEYDISADLPNGISVAIEYDGKQHFQPIRFGGMSIERAEKALVKAKFNDSRKNQLSIDNNIHLFRIHYKDYKQNPNETMQWLYDHIDYLAYTDPENEQPDVYYTESYTS